MQAITASSVRLLSTAICAAPLLAMAGPTVAEPITTAPATNPWEFRITPLYGWLTALEGTTGPDVLPANVDESFSDILDVLKCTPPSKWKPATTAGVSSPTVSMRAWATPDTPPDP